jgi:AAA15 family ATPase/GTPase
MIVSFSVSNFRSFQEEQTFSLVASKRLSDSHVDHLVPIPDSNETVLRTAVLYGANGAGKSNLFKALRYVREVARRPRERNSGTGRQAFCFGETAAEPSAFDLQFISQGKLYRFGFKVDDDRVIEEWLIHVAGARERILYERLTDANGEVVIEAPGLEKTKKKLAALATVGGPANQSFLATVQATLESPEIGDELASILHWFENELVLIGPDESLASMGQVFTADSELLSFAGAYLKNASTGVDHLKLTKTEVTEDELRGLLPEPILASIMSDLRKNKKREGGAVVQLGEGNELLIERKDGDRFYRMRIEAAHEHKDGKIVPLALNEESDGTCRLLHLVPALHHSRSNSATHFIDEIDRSLHPILVKNFLESFLSTCAKGARQVIVTTHESNLLDQDLLRRDEIWFAEKDQKAVTHLYSLMDFKVRNDLEIRKHYLQGRFGAIPFFGNLDGLLQEKGQVE